MTRRWRTSIPSLLLSLIIALAWVTTGCEGELQVERTDVGDGESPYPPGHIFSIDEVEVMLEGGTRLPVEYLVVGMEWTEEKPILSLDETAAALASDPDFEELRLALEAGGFSEEQIQQMVYLAGAHGSGQEADSIRYRHSEIRGVYEDAIHEFDQELRAAEQAQDVRVRRDYLQQLGVFTTLDTQVVP